MKLLYNPSSSIVLSIGVAIVSTVCVTQTSSLDVGGFLDGFFNRTNLTDAIDIILDNNTYWDTAGDTDTVLDTLFNETNTTDAWNVMKDYLADNQLTLAPENYFEDILDSENFTQYLEGNGIVNGTIDWNATYIIDDLMNRTNLTDTWERIKMNVTNMNMSMPSMIMSGMPAMAPTMMGGGGGGDGDMSQAPASTPTMMGGSDDKKNETSKATMAPASAPTMMGNNSTNNNTNTTVKPPTNSTSSSTSIFIGSKTGIVPLLILIATSSVFAL